MDLVGRYSNPDDLLTKIRRLVDLPRTPRPRTRGRPRQVQHHLTDDELASLLDAYDAGMTIDHLADSFGVHGTTVLSQLDRAAVERRTGVVNRRIEEARSLYAGGWSLARIGADFGVNAETVRRALMAAGVTLRARRGWG